MSINVDECKECGAAAMKVGRACTQSGSEIFPMYCAACGDVTTVYVKKSIALQLPFVETVKTRTQKFMEKKQIQIACEVCKKPEGELHHWAPFHIFKDESDHWPTSHLCRACHARWHRLVTPNMSHTLTTTNS